MTHLIPGCTSTGSKRPEALFGSSAGPRYVSRASGCRVWDEVDTEYVDYIMALGAVGLGYAHPAVTDAVRKAAADGIVGPLPPKLEGEVAEQLVSVLPGAERIQFFKTGAEAVAAAVRVARVVTGREAVIGCGYHGWLDWCSPGEGVPQATCETFTSVPFGEAQAIDTIETLGRDVAAVVVEPVVDAAPPDGWLEAVRDRCSATGAVLVFDEIKTAFRLAPGGAAERWGVIPDLSVVGKALANGLPLAAVAGRAAVMDGLNRTWVSSTLATESVSLAAARAVLAVHANESVCERLGELGSRLHAGLARLAASSESVRVRGIPEMCYLEFERDGDSTRFASRCAARGVLFKRNAYNFVSFAHDESAIDETLSVVQAALDEC